MAHLQYVDELIKEYLVFRGFTSTLRSLDNDLKNDKDKGFRVDRITNQILNHIQTYDLNGLRDLWAHLDRRLFNHLSPSLLPCVKKLETSVLRLYVINTVQTNKSDKLDEFFDKMAPELQNHSEWKDWFVLPYLKSIEDIPTFSMYFTKQWQDTLFVSFQNFLAIVFQNMKLPTLANFSEEANKIKKLQEENDLLRSRLKMLTTTPDISFDMSEGGVDFSCSPFIMDDFSQIPQEASNSESHPKSLKSLFGLSSGYSPPTNVQMKSQRSSQSNSHSRRASSQAPSEDKRKPRSSSLAPINRSRDHVPVKKQTSYSSTGGAHVSRSPTKGHPSSSQDLRSQRSVDNSAPFLLLSRDYYPDHRAVVSHSVFNHTGTLVASADMDGVVKLWSPYPDVKTEDSIVMRGAITALEWMPKTDKFLLIASKSGCIRLYDTQDKKTAFDILPENVPIFKENRIMCVKATPSEANFLVSVAPRLKLNSESQTSTTPSLHIFDFKTQKLETTMKLDGAIVNTCSPNHNGGLLVCGCNDGMIRILDLRSGDVVVSWLAHQGEVFTLKLSVQEDKIYSIGSDNKSLHDKAAGPFIFGLGPVGVDSSSHGYGAGSGGGRSVLLRPYGSLFAFHQENNLFTCSPNGPIVYKIKENELQYAMSLRGHTSSVITIDCCSALQCGSCVSASLDGRVSLSTLLPQ
ncbi:WD repeat-containing protein 91 [Armadillidium vulgare]|nr:WD repeat-containing protein 91 [Armadillidium vulgare]